MTVTCDYLACPRRASKPSRPLTFCTQHKDLYATTIPYGNIATSIPPKCLVMVHCDELDRVQLADLEFDIRQLATLHASLNSLCGWTKRGETINHWIGVTNRLISNRHIMINRKKAMAAAIGPPCDYRGCQATLPKARQAYAKRDYPVFCKHHYACMDTLRNQCIDASYDYTAARDARRWGKAIAALDSLVFRCMTYMEAVTREGLAFMNGYDDWVKRMLIEEASLLAQMPADVRQTLAR